MYAAQARLGSLLWALHGHKAITAKQAGSINGTVYEM